MSYLYCQSCGSKNSYIGDKPNFCSSCGNGVGGVAKATPAPARNTIKRGSGLIRVDESNSGLVRADESDENEDESDIDYVPHIGGIEVDIDMGNIGMSQTYAAHEIIGTNVETPQDQKIEEKEPKQKAPVRRSVKPNRSRNSKKA